MPHAIIDGMGNLNVRVYPDVASLPTVRLGALVAVDNGTDGSLYVGLHDATGTLIWARYPVLVIVKNPAASENKITAPTDVHALIISHDNKFGLEIDGTGNESGLFIFQASGGENAPLLALSRDTMVPADPFSWVLPGDGTTGGVINGSGEFQMRFWSSLPTPSVDHWGAIAILEGGSGVADSFWECIKDATGSYVWTQLVGATGPAGPAGVTPQLRESSGYIQVSYDSGATWTNLLPLTDITGPAGPTGATGANGIVDFPALPGTTDPPLSFQVIIPASGFVLPWGLPINYVVNISDIKGLWEVDNAEAVPYITTYAGSPTDNDPSRGLPYGLMIYVAGFPNGADIVEDITTAAAWNVPYTALGSDVVKIFANNDADGGSEGYMVATITITPGSPPPAYHTIDFRTGVHGFTINTMYGSATQTDGIGITADTDTASMYVFKDWIGSGHITRLKWYIHSATNIGDNFYHCYYGFGAGTPPGPNITNATDPSDLHYAVYDLTGLSVDVSPGGGTNLGLYWPGTAPGMEFYAIDIYTDDGAIVL